MLTLTEARLEIGLEEGDTTDDADLSRSIRQVVSRIRQRTERFIAWRTDSITQVNTDVHIRCIGHQLNTGETVRVENSDCTPSLDGVHIVSVLNEDTLVITGETITEPGTRATLHPLWAADFVGLESNPIWIPQQYLPLLEITQVSVRTSLTEWEAVDATDYFQSTDDDQAKAMSLTRTSGCWPVVRAFPRYQHALARRSNLKNIRVQFYCGTRTVPHDIEMAGLSMVCDLYEMQGGPKDLQSTSFEGVSSQRMTGVEAQSHVFSPESVMMSWVAR